ncbi:MAG TPA: hypothetical protein DDY98_00030, partial [Ruminococcaceae bacterium]|nr:hypothetical protein [Oscillospiraceae bacterium]
MEINEIFDILLSMSRYLVAALAVMVLGSCVVSLVSRRFGKRIGSYLYDPGSKKRLPLTRWENSIGRSKTCDIVLTMPDISRFHAVISKRRDGWVVADTNSSTGVFVNGNTVTKPTPIVHGDKVYFGSACFVFVDADEDDKEQEEREKRREFSRKAAVRAVRMKPQAQFDPALIDEAGDKAYIIGCDSCVFGRNSECDVRLRYTAISPKHARITSQGSAWFIEDMNSLGGTTVNAKPLGNGRRRLR